MINRMQIYILQNTTPRIDERNKENVFNKQFNLNDKFAVKYIFSIYIVFLWF